jgi:hypothetical protein
MAYCGCRWRAVAGLAALAFVSACGSSTNAPTPTPTTAVGRWTGPQLLEENTDVSAVPRVVLNSKGQGFSAWDSAAGIETTYFDGTRWQPLSLLPVSRFHLVQGAAVNAASATIVAWIHRLEGTRAAEVWASRGSLASGFGGPERIDADDPEAGFDNFSMDAAMDSAGNAIVVWSAIVAFAKRFDVGQGWQGPVILSHEPTNRPGVSTDAAGNALLVWQENFRGRVARFVPLSGFLPEEDYDPAARGASQPTLALASAGRGFIGWSSPTGNPPAYQLKIRSVSSTAPGLGPVVALGADLSGGVVLAVNDEGRGVAVWATRIEELWASLFEPATGWQVPERLVGSDARAASVGLDTQGRALLVFSQWNGTRDVLQARRYVRGRGWSSAEVIDARGHSILPSLALDPVGDALVVWTELLPQGGKNIWSNRFDPNLN